MSGASYNLLNTLSKFTHCHAWAIWFARRSSRQSKLFSSCVMGYGFTALNSARLTPMNHEKDGIHFVWKTNKVASVICKNDAMKKPFTSSMAEAEI
jgi:hypothetical protein